MLRVAIQDPSRGIPCYISHGRLTGVNILGMDVMRQLRITIEAMDFEKESFRLDRI